jgi:hypothetical protein
MRNIENIKRGGRKSSPTRDRKRHSISSENTKRRIKRTKRRHNERIRSHMKKKL